MQIKPDDGREGDLVALDLLLDRPDVATATRKRIETEVRTIQAGQRAECDSAYQIELYFGRSENWATIHGLRIEVDGLVAQIDHLVINRRAEIWVCGSKSFAERVSINKYDEWSCWSHGRREGMPSPIEQNRRHIHLLERVFDEGLAPLPRRFGLAPIRPRLRGLVLVSDNAKINRPRRKVDGVDQVIKAEALKTKLFDALDAAPTRDFARFKAVVCQVRRPLFRVRPNACQRNRSLMAPNTQQAVLPRVRPAMSREEVVVRSASQESDFLSLSADRWDGSAGYEGPDIEVSLCARGLVASAVLPAYVGVPDWLAPFFRMIDEDWRGWSGQRKAVPNDSPWFNIAATHDGKGHVELTVRLTQGWPHDDEWLVEAKLPIDVASTDAIARDLDRWVERIWPTRQRNR